MLKFKFELIKKENGIVERERVNVVSEEDFNSYLNKNRFKNVESGIYEFSDSKNIKRVTVL